MAVEVFDRNRGFDHLGLRDRVLALRAMDSLGHLDLSALALIAEHTCPKSWREGEVILREGEPITEVQIVTRGLIRVTRHGQLVTDVRRGYGAGFLSVLARDPYGVTATAVTATESLALSVDILVDSFEQNFSLLRNALRLSAGSVIQARGNLPTEERDDDADPGVYPARPLTFVEHLIEIRSNGVFANANVDAAVEVVRRSREVRGSAGDVLFEIGDHADFWCAIQYGRIRCENEAGESTTVGSDFILGVMEPLAAIPRQYRAVAETDYIYVRTEFETMLAVFEAHFDLGMDFVANMSRGLLAGSDGSDESDESDAGGEDEREGAPVESE